MPYRILLVDEDESASALILSALADGDSDLKIVKGLEEASSALASFAPHVIIVCASQEERYEFALIRALRLQTGISVIMICDCDTCEKAGQILQDGIDFIVRPSPPGQIRSIVRRAFERMELESQKTEFQKSLEEKERQISFLEKRLQQTERLAALGKLTAGLAHDMSAPLGSINSNNDVLQLAFEKVQALLKRHGQMSMPGVGEEIANLANMIEDTIKTDRLACNYIERMVNGMRNFARGDSGERRKADIHERIEVVLAIIAHELKHRIQVIKEFGSIPQLECYPNQLDQVFLNILVNASQAISGQGEIKIRTWEEAGTVRIAISDTGCGIASEFHDRIFEPGFTTKETGTGLGLSTCRKITTDLGGRVEFSSQVGKGSTFTIVLPIRKTEEKDKNG
jgi:signal transduction histidine kinase